MAASTSGITPLSFFEQQTGLPRSYAVLSGSGVYLALVFLNIGGMGQLLSNIAGFVIPGYYSLIALDTVSKADDTELLTYWVVFAFLNVIEFWSRAILYWIPFYFLFKTIFLLWAGIPPFGGSKVVYVNIIKPVTDKYIKKSASEKVSEAAEGVSTSVEI
ncbi:CIC11C00000002815 [Sungouiella intermedia]|uniref:Protein YOP1 n=1 Tax=Sungouiella intermedia TaxID=45354 RepID=A0A1L0DES9_9ASCO|nr:CIC11C00000002815 [[Candida] intermedia]